MIYEELGPVSREEAALLLAGGNPEAMATTIVRLALHDDERTWVEQRCLRFASHPEAVVRRAVAVALGHLARIHCDVDLDRVVPALRRLEQDPAVAGAASDALEDIAIYAADRKPGEAA